MCGGNAPDDFDTSGLTEILFDDIKNLSIRNGVFRCTLYAYRMVVPGSEPTLVPVLNIALPVDEVRPVAGKAIAKVAVQVVQTAKEFVSEKLAAVLH